MLLIDPTSITQFVHQIAEHDKFAFDIETTGLKAMEGDRLCGFSLHHPDVGSCYVPVRHQRDMFTTNAPESVLQELECLFRGKTRLVIGHNLGFDLGFLRQEGFDVDDVPIFDTQYAAFLWNDSLQSYGLKPLTSNPLVLNNPQGRDPEAAVKRWRQRTKGKTSFDHIPLELMVPYAEQDVELAWALYEFLEPRLKAEGSLYEQLFKEEMQWVHVLSRLGAAGLLVDFDRLQEMITSHEEESKRLIAEIGGGAFNSFNPMSVPDVKKVVAFHMSKRLDRPITPKDIVTIEEQALRRYRDAYNLTVIDKITRARQIRKVLGSWLYPFQKYGRLGQGRIYALFGAAGARQFSGDTDRELVRTDRVKCRDPNLMAIAVYDSDIYRAKEAIIAPPGCQLVSMDFSQIEIRIAADYAEDWSLIEILCDPDGDVHGAVAVELGMKRNGAKRVVFGTGIYGAGDSRSSTTLTEELNREVSEDEARGWRLAFEREHPSFKRMRQRAESRVLGRRFKDKRGGWIELWNGRKLFFGGHDSSWKAYNWLIQGGVAQIVKRAMVRIDSLIRERSLATQMILQVHDEVLLEVPDNELQHLADIHALMEGIERPGIAWRMPLKVDVAMGTRWSELKEVSLEELHGATKPSAAAI